MAAKKKKIRIFLFVSTISLLTALISITVPEFSSQGIQILLISFRSRKLLIK